MIQIRPVSDLRNNFPAIEKAISGGEPVYLTKNGYGAMVVLSLESYAQLTENTESALVAADMAAAADKRRYTHDEVFAKLRGLINEQNEV